MPPLEFSHHAPELSTEHVEHFFVEGWGFINSKEGSLELAGGFLKFETAIGGLFVAAQFRTENGKHFFTQIFSLYEVLHYQQFLNNSFRSLRAGWRSQALRRTSLWPCPRHSLSAPFKRRADLPFRFHAKCQAYSTSSTRPNLQVLSCYF